LRQFLDLINHHMMAKTHKLSTCTSRLSSLEEIWPN
jgi:hypothetical protein